MTRHMTTNTTHDNGVHTGPDGAVANSLANGLVGTGIASQYRLQPRAGF